MQVATNRVKPEIPPRDGFDSYNIHHSCGIILMYMFDYENMHGNVYVRIQEFMQDLKKYAVTHNRMITINRMYLIDNELRFNITINRNKFLFTLSETKISVSRINPKTSISEKHEIKILQIANGEFINAFS